MQLSNLVATSQSVAKTRKRKEKTEHLAACVRALAGDEIHVGVSYLAGRIPQGKIGIGYAKLRDTLEVSPAAVPTLTLSDVHRTLDAIVEMRGAGSVKRRLEALGGLLRRATEDEQAFLRRLLIGEVRQGALDGIVIEAIAQAAEVPAAEVRRAQMLAADLGAVAEAARADGRAGLARFDLRLFTPLLPMLAQTAADPYDALERLERAAFETKLDGARVQVHKQGDEVRVYSRRLNDVTDAVPEVVEVARRLEAEEIVLDGETIATAPDGRPRSFQTTMRRYGRRLDVEKLRVELPLSTYFFDCLRLDGRTLIDLGTEARFRALAAVVPEQHRVPRIVTAEPEVADRFYADALARGHEGVMAKDLEVPYEAGSRGAGWLKIKQVHSLDLVVLAVEWGSGRREGWLSNLHLGARDPAGGFVMLGKTFKGLTDELLTWQTERLQAIATRHEGHVVYVRPELVVEIAFNDVQTSPHYPGGVALRFARVKRYRPDKPASEADTIETVRGFLPPE